jgi:Family of unknown function (DUF6776)
MMESGNRKILVYRPAYLWTAAGVALIVVIAGSYLLFRYGVGYAGSELDRLTRQQDKLQQQLAGESSLNADLRQQLAIQQRSSEIDRRASLEVRNDFARLQDKLQALRKELAFYRGIVSPADNQAGLTIQRFELQRGSTASRYTYNLMLTQVRRNDQFAQGVVEIVVDGVQDGKRTELSFDRLRVDGGGALKFRFRYFQDFDGEVEIPAEFEPQHLVIRARTSGKGQPPDVEKTMEWPG